MSLLQKTPVKLFLIGLALIIVTAFAYWPIHEHEFVLYDDDLYVSHNATVQRGLTAEGFNWAFTSGHAFNWHPLTWISHMLDCQLFGLNAGAHHLVSLVFHIANSLLLFLLFSKMTGAIWRSAFVAALFALHPLHVESVAWAAERKDVLSTFFGLLTIWFYARYAQARAKAEGRDPRFDQVGYFLALFFFALGLMSKPMLVTLPCVLLLLDFWPLNRVSFATLKKCAPRLLLEKLPFFALTIISSFVTFLVQKRSGAMVMVEDFSLIDRIGNVLVTYVRYLSKMFWPRDLAVLYPIETWSSLQIGGAVIVLLAVSFVAVKLAAQRPYYLVGWLWYLGVLIPVIGLVQVGMQSMADRYTYLPLIGIFIMIAWGVFDLFRAPKFRTPLWTAAILALVLCATLTRAQVAHWRTSETLFEHALRSTKGNHVLMRNLANVRIQQGRFDDAGALLLEAIRINPTSANWSSLAGVFVGQGRNDEAKNAYDTALKIDPNNQDAAIGLGLLESGGDPATEIRLLTEALRLHPDFAKGHELLAEAHYKAGDAAISSGDIDEARGHYEEAVRKNPDHIGAQCNLGLVLFRLDKPDEALPHVETAVRLNPNSFEARYLLSEILLRLGRFADAEAHARAVVQLQPEQPDAQSLLGRALAGQKKRTEAQAVFSRALQLAQRANNREFVELISAQLADLSQ